MLFNLTWINKHRFFEILPGLLVWLTFTLAIVISFIRPIWAIYFIIVFDTLWLVRVYYLTVHLLVSYANFRKGLKVDWLEKVKSLTAKNWTGYWHLVFLPTYQEPFSVIDKTFSALKNSDYPKNHLIVVLAGEERDRANFLNIAEQITEKYHSHFLKIFVTLHPKNLPNEIPGKGSNLNYAGHQAKILIDELKIPYEKVIVSAFDIDTQVYPQYFSYLTYKYLTHSKPTRASYQPLALYHNNIWESDPVTRVVANSTTFWLLTDLARNERLFTFSSHSMSFKALVDVDFWQKDIVTEDSRIFLQCLFKYDGDYEVVPMYIPVSMNTVYSGNFWHGLASQYRQMRRWAWGVEHIPYMIKQFKEHPHMPLKKKMYYYWNQSEGVYSWATAPILIFIMGRLPLLLANKVTQASVVAQNAPIILEWLMNSAMVGLVISAIISTVILPKKPENKSWFYYPIMLLQWIIFPLTMIIFGSIPATDAQTRMMLGKRFKLGFWVTKKR